MKILVLSFYYPPDLSAGSFRTGHLVQALRHQAGAACDITVLTTVPNRYHSFRAEVPGFEEHEGVRIQRIELPTHRGGFVSQARAFAVYAKAVRNLVVGLSPDVVYATSSRLMTAVLGASVAHRVNAPLYLDIRDIFVDTIGDVLWWPLAAATQPVFAALESYAIRSASTVNLVSKGFQRYFIDRYPGQRYTFFSNGIDPEFLTPMEPDANGEPTPAGSDESRVLRIVYAGNIGDGQGLHAIIPQLARQLEGKASFIIIGDGGRKADLCRAVAAAGCSNVAIRDPVGRDCVRREYAAADVLFLHLNDYDAFAKVLPSKVFEYAATGKPILAGVRGYAAEFLKSEVSNCGVFHPCDSREALDALACLERKTVPREGFISRYARTAICERMARDILSTAGSCPAMGSESKDRDWPGAEVARTDNDD